MKETIQKKIEQINDRLRSVYELENILIKKNLKKKEFALEIGKIAYQIKKEMLSNGKTNKEINTLFKVNFKKDKRRINEYIAIYKVITKNNKLKDADLSVLIILGQALSSDCALRKKKAKNMIASGLIRDNDKKHKQSIKQSNREEVKKELSSVKEIPEYQQLHKLRKLSYMINELVISLNNELFSNGLNKSFHESFRTIALDTEERLLESTKSLSSLRVSINKEVKLIKNKKNTPIEYINDEEANSILENNNYSHSLSFAQLGTLIT